MGRKGSIYARFDASIGRAQKDREEDSLDNLELIKPKVPHRFDARASRLLTIYNATKGWYDGLKFRARTKDSGVLMLFKRVAKMITEYEDETKEDVDDALFVVAVFLRYRSRTYPGHLLGKDALDIYHERLGELVKQISSGYSTEYQTLEYLCSVRKETPRQVIDGLESSGLFTPKFIKDWRRRNANL